MNSVKILRQNGGIPASLPGEDHISGMLFYLATLPTAKSGVTDGFSATERIRPVSTIERAEELGITPDNASWEIRLLHYHLSEVFRTNPGIILYLSIYPKPAGGSYTFAELKTLQRYASGRLRQVGIWLGDKVADASLVTTLEGVADTLDSEEMPLSVLLAPKVTAPVASLPTNLAGGGKSRVSILIAQDGEGVAKTLYTDAANNAAKASVSALGTFLGILSRAAVHHSIGWVQQYPLGLALPAFGDGTLLRALDKAVVDTLDKARYIFAVTYPAIGDCYASDSHTLDEPTSDYNAIERVRTMDKAVRGVRKYLTPELGGNIYIDKETGKMQDYTVKHLEGVASRALEEMERAGELSGYRAYVNPEQSVLATSTVEVVIREIPTGVLRSLQVKIGFTQKL